MAGAPTTIEVIPSAARLIGSLRDVGYDFVHAVADLVDNSIAADATEVAIDLRFDGKDSWVRIVDNGHGMSGSEITEAMRFGSARDYELDDLGKFGLGLKTASLSQCRKLTVASRSDPSARRIEVRRWDLSHVERTNRWEIVSLGVDERDGNLTTPLKDHIGTVVLWENLDRVLKYRIPWGKSAKNGLLRLAEQLDAHLAMVFHRFLAGEARRKKKLRITINGTVVEPWDPFARDEPKTTKLDYKEFDLDTEVGRGTAAYSAYVLPPKHLFSSPQAFEKLAGPAKWNNQQGFYIYRSDRMIQSGGWCYIRAADEHTKLARIALDFLPDLDSAFQLNVAKARVNLPDSLKDQIKPFIERLVKQARQVYDHGERSGSTSSAGRMSATGSGGNGQTGSGIQHQPVGHDASSGPPGTARAGSAAGSAIVVPQAVRAHQLGRILETAARSAGETAALNKIKKVLRQSHPEIANDLGW